MRSGIIVVLSTLALWSALQARAQACSCVAPDFNRSYQNADHVLHVRVLGTLITLQGQSWYLGVTLDEDYKGCWPANRLVLLTSAADSASCGMPLTAGTEYLLHGQDAGRRFGLRALSVGLCDANGAWDELDPAQLDFLNTRYKCCGDSCACVGSTQVQCLVDPCQVSTCDVEGASCSANYCGGCNAEWTDPSGALVCAPGTCDYEDPERTYQARDPQQCASLRFACDPGQAPFFDSCGCGCEAQHPTVVEPCRVGGCSGQLCLGPDDGDGITDCLFRPEYACYRSASCEPQAESGVCAWTPTPELQACITDAQASASTLEPQPEPEPE